MSEETSMTPIAPLIEAFLRENTRPSAWASRHTCDSCAQSFQLLSSVRPQAQTRPSRLMLEQIDAGLSAPSSSI
jgi:hypothetical protein